MKRGRSIRVMETTPAALLDVETGKELSSSFVWPALLIPLVSSVSHFTRPWPRSSRANSQVLPLILARFLVGNKGELV